MTYKVGDRVSWRGDPGVIWRFDPDAFEGLYIVEFEDGTFGQYYEGELEEA